MNLIISFKNLVLDRDDYINICLNKKILVLSYGIYGESGIELYDVNSLKLEKSLELEASVKNILFEKELVYVITRCYNHYTIVYLLNIFDENLQHLGSRDHVTKSNNVFLRNQKIFSQIDYSINIMNDDYGFLQPDFKIEKSFELVGITKNDEIIALNSNIQLIHLYKIDGTLVNKFSISN